MEAAALDPETTVTVASPPRRPAVRPTLAVGAGLALLVGLLVGLAVFRAPQFSPFDEGTHADYAYQLAHGHIPYAGSKSAPQVSREAACHGFIIQPRTQLPPCGTADPPVSDNYNFGHPPLYYGVTGVVARLADGAVGGEHFVTAARLVGAVWLWAGALVLFLAVRAFGAPWPFAAVAAGLLPLAPGVLHASSTVTNDAAAALSGALAMLVLARILVHERLGWVFPTLAAFGAAATKVLNALPFLVLAVVLLPTAVAAWRRQDRVHARSLLAVCGGMVGAVLVVYEGWALFQSTREVPGWVNPILGVTGRPLSGSPVDEILSTSFNGFNLVSGYLVQDTIDSPAMLLWARALNALVLAAPLMAMVVWPRRSAGWMAGVVTLGGMLAFPLVVEVQVYVSSHLYFPGVNARYGMSLIPGALVCAALVAWRRGALRLAAVGAAAGGLAVALTVGGLVT
jgi:hypothetical protein